jgi:hypothetical protein
MTTAFGIFTTIVAILLTWSAALTDPEDHAWQFLRRASAALVWWVTMLVIEGRITVRWAGRDRWEGD